MYLVKHHDDDENPPAAPAVSDLEINTQVLCAALEAGFNRDGNPVQVFQAFEFSMKAGLYPPLWALNYLRKAFVAKFDSGRTFDSALGFSKEGLGSGRHDDPLEQRRKAARDRKLILDVFRLEALGFSKRAACDLVVVRLERVGGESLSGRHLANIVDRARATFAHERELIHTVVGEWSETQRAELLREFDAAAGPKRATRKR